MQCGPPITDDLTLMKFCTQLNAAKRLFDRVGQAFEEAQETGYSIVPPEESEMTLAQPSLVKKNGRTGVSLRADAPSYHVIRVDVAGEVSPALGNEEQSAAFVRQLTADMETDPARAWETNMFGKSLKDLLGGELAVKNRAMSEPLQKKMRRTVTRIVNEGRGGVICILL